MSGFTARIVNCLRGMRSIWRSISPSWTTTPCRALNARNPDPRGVQLSLPKRAAVWTDLFFMTLGRSQCMLTVLCKVIIWQMKGAALW